MSTDWRVLGSGSYPTSFCSNIVPLWPDSSPDLRIRDFRSGGPRGRRVLKHNQREGLNEKTGILLVWGWRRVPAQRRRGGGATNRPHSSLYGLVQKGLISHCFSHCVKIKYRLSYFIWVLGDRTTQGTATLVS